MPSLRILRRDIRRKYSTMISNVFNSHDIDFVAKFFQEFSLPNLEICHEFGDCFSPPSYHLRRSQEFGIDKIVESFRINFHLIPDSVFRFTDVKVCQKLREQGSRIISYATVTGTMLYEMKKHVYDSQDGINVVHPDYCQDDITLTDSNVEVLTKLKKPIEFLIQSVIIFDLDSNHRIKSMTFSK